MENAPLISICIPAYERAEYLKRLLDSIQSQHFRNFEVIITDDSRGDEVKNLVSGHAIFSKVHYYKNRQTLGSPENWNEGLRKSTGDWIKPMHDDDWFQGPGSLGVYAQVSENTAASFAFSSFTNVYPDGSRRFIDNAGHVRMLNRNPEALIASNRIGPPSCILFRRDDSLFFDNQMKWLVDIDFYIRYLKAHGKALYISEPLVQIGISETQVTQSSFGNPQIEIPERFLLQEKMHHNSLNNILIYDSWWRFIRNMKIRSTDQISAAGFSGNIPLVIKNIIGVQNKIPRPMLKTGVISKLLMGSNFLFRHGKNENG